MNGLGIERLNTFYVVIFYLSLVVLIKKRANNKFTLWTLSYSLLGILSMLVSHLLLDIMFVALFLTLMAYGASMLKKSNSKKCFWKAIYILMVATLFLLYRLWFLVLLFLPQAFVIPRWLDTALFVLLVYDCMQKVEVLDEHCNTKTT